MTTIYGYVKLKETNEPIAGLVVSVYARDMAQASTKAKTKVSDPFQLYTRSLGSAITNAHGEFRIEFDLKTSEASKAQGQPELMLAVLAPATTEAANRVAAPSPFKRLLHWTELPHLGADQSEAFVIRLLDEQLKQFDIRMPRDQIKRTVEQSVARLVEAERDSLRFHTALRVGLAPMRKELLTRRREITEAAKHFVAPVYATPKAARSQPNWVTFKSTTDQAARYTMEEGLTHIATAAARSPSRVGLNLTDDQLVAAGFSEPSRVTVQGLKIDHEQLCALLNSRRGGPEMVYVRGLLEARKAAAEAEARLREEGPIEEETPEEEVPVEEEESALAIRRRVLGQLRDMPVDGLVATGTRAEPLTAEELNAMLPSVRLGAGPADVPAFHDFYHLQIAFPHVWTEAFDEELRAQVQQLYEESALLHEDSGVEFEGGAELEEIKDLRNFLSEISGQWGVHYFYPPTTVVEHIGVDGYTWYELTQTARSRLEEIADKIDSTKRYIEAHWLEEGEQKREERKIRALKNQADALLEAGMKTRMMRLLKGISSRLSEPYAFHYFAPNTVNFGLLMSYRQKWQPGQYQVGDLVSTIPLVPGEKRKYTTKQVIKRTRAETELEKSLASKSREMTTTRRVEAEIAAKASFHSNFQMTSEGSFRFAIGEITAGTQFAVDQAQESSSVKKDFREAVLKASQEYKQERSLEVKTTDELTSETTTSGELSNPNNELTVTYLLYELERQYTISERIHRVTPVVLVAQDVPAPHEITESWLLAHEWILRRVLLDDSFAPALDYLTDAFAGEELSVSVKKANWDTQRELVETLQITVNELLSAQERFRTQLIASEESRARAAAAEEAQGWLTDLFENLTVGDFGELAVADMEAKVKSIQKQLEYLEEGLGQKREELALAREALEETTRSYTAALEAQTNRRVAIDQLRIHVKENILYYMQAIWDHEPPDQRFFRLYHIEVDLPESPTRTCTLRRATEEEEASGIPFIEREGRRYIIEGCEPPALPDPASPNRKRLVEIADLDKPLGYKGNYMIFPLKTCLYLTDFMMREFFDDYFGVRDPDLAANFTVEELLQYTEVLMRDETVTLNDEQREALQRMVMTKLRQPRRDSDLVVVPTGELYMEALLGEHALLEKFKLNHRFFDMAKARAEWREAELENLRRAARLLQEEPNLEDPDVDKRIVVEGTSDVHVDTP
jgi:hypothetical protein